MHRDRPILPLCTSGQEVKCPTCLHIQSLPIHSFPLVPENHTTSEKCTSHHSFIVEKVEGFFFFCSKEHIEQREVRGIKIWSPLEKNRRMGLCLPLSGWNKGRICDCWREEGEVNVNTWLSEYLGEYSVSMCEWLCHHGDEGLHGWTAKTAEYMESMSECIQWTCEHQPLFCVASVLGDTGSVHLLWSPLRQILRPNSNNCN